MSERNNYDYIDDFGRPEFTEAQRRLLGTSLATFSLSMLLTIASLVHNRATQKSIMPENICSGISYEQVTAGTTVDSEVLVLQVRGVPGEASEIKEALLLMNPAAIDGGNDGSTPTFTGKFTVFAPTDCTGSLFTSQPPQS